MGMTLQDWRASDRKRIAREKLFANTSMARAFVTMVELNEPFAEWKGRRLTPAVFFLLTRDQRRAVLAWAWPRSWLSAEMQRLAEDFEDGLLD